MSTFLLRGALSFQIPPISGAWGVGDRYSGEKNDDLSQ